MAAHRYWRIQFTSGAPDSGVWIAEVELWEAGVNVTGLATKSGAAPSSGFTVGGATGVNAVWDGNLNSEIGWNTAVLRPGNARVDFDFGGTPRDIDKVRLGMGDVTGGVARQWPGARLFYSDNGTTWTQDNGVSPAMPAQNAYAELVKHAASGQWRPLPSVSLQAHRYWRVRIGVMPPGQDGAILSEVRLFEGASDVTASATVSSGFVSGSLSTGGGGSNSAGSNNLTYLTDGSLSTVVYFKNAGAVLDGWVTFDFGAGNAKAIDGVKIGAAPDSWSDVEYFPENIPLEYSDNGSTYTQFACLVPVPQSNVLSPTLVTQWVEAVAGTLEGAAAFAFTGSGSLSYPVHIAGAATFALSHSASLQAWKLMAGVVHLGQTAGSGGGRLVGGGLVS